MIRSMTGFGAATGPVGTAQVTVELRTVNHRFFNASIKLPAALLRWEGEVREALRRRIGRGHVNVAARIERASSGIAGIDETRLAAYAAQLRDVQVRLGLGGELDLATLLRLPSVFTADGGDDIGGSVAELVAVTEQAADALLAMRAREGARLRDLLLARSAVVLEGVERIALRSPERLVSERERLRKSVRELAEGVDLDDARLAQEIALLADRLDVSEEIDRFRMHVAAFRDTLQRAGDDPVGKRLGFLLQEMLREANTTGSKARDAAMTHEVVAVKEELERLAEQVENIE